jgi:hypothetical protein
MGRRQSGCWHWRPFHARQRGNFRGYFGPNLGTPRSLERYRVEIRLPCSLVDLFHNGAGGYRAQFYESIELGEEANAYCHDAILSAIKSQETRRDQNWMDTPEAASLYCETTKVWIHQGLWFHQEWICLRNLQVPRWSCDPKRVDARRR